MLEGAVPEAIARTRASILLATFAALGSQFWLQLAGYSFRSQRNNDIYPCVKGYNAAEDQGLKEWGGSRSSPATFQEPLHPDMWGSMDISLCRYD